MSKPSELPSDSAESDEPKGCVAWIPAFVAAASLLLIVFFVVCAGGTYWLFEQRGELALNTIEGSYLPLIEQSRLDPASKLEVVAELESFVARGRAGEFENEQIAGVIQRLVRAPIISWGDLQALAAIVERRETLAEDVRSEIVTDISRVMRGAELDTVTQFEMLGIMEPVSQESQNDLGYILHDTFTDQQLQEFGTQVKAVAEASEVPERQYDVTVTDIVRRQIDAGISSGTR